MEQYLIAFITGLTTGGLSCLAVQRSPECRCTCTITSHVVNIFFLSERAICIDTVKTV